MGVDRAQIVAAAEERMHRERAAPSGALYVDHDAEHPRRQELRRIIDIDIVEGNGLKIGVEFIKFLINIAEKILKEPKKEKYRKIGRNRKLTQEVLLKHKGVFAYFLELGFRSKEVKEGEEIFVFDDAFLGDLRLGLELLREALKREEPRAEREAKKIELEKAAKLEAEENAKKKIADDRISVKHRVMREAAVRREGSAPPSSPRAMGSPPSQISTAVSTDATQTPQLKTPRKRGNGVVHTLYGEITIEGPGAI